MLRVAITTSQNGDASCQYRLRWPAEVLHKQGQVMSFAPRIELEMKFHSSAPLEVVGAEKIEADVLILQRPTDKFLVDAIPFYQEQGIAVVVELDDDLERIDSAHSAYRFYHPSVNLRNNWQHLKRACHMADMVVVSTPALTRYASHGRVAVIRNYVPISYLELETFSTGKVIGWGGTILSHPRDLQVTRGGVGAAVKALGATFKVVGDGDGAQKLLNLHSRPITTGMVDLKTYIREIATLDVAIAPLADTAFNRAKSWLKAIDALSLGVPVVASQTPEYQALKFYMDGFLMLVPDRSRDWKRAIKRQLEVAQDAGARREVRQLVADDFTIEVNCYQWLAAWQAAVDHRKSS